MSIPKPPWYKAINDRLEGSEWLVNTLLVIVVVVSIFLLLQKDRVAKTTWLIYLVSP